MAQERDKWTVSVNLGSGVSFGVAGVAHRRAETVRRVHLGRRPRHCHGGRQQRCTGCVDDVGAEACPPTLLDARQHLRPEAAGVAVGEAAERLPRHAVRAVPAEHAEARDHVVTRAKVAHPGADGLDNSGRFMTEDEWHRERHPVAGQCMEVAVAHPGCLDPDQDLADPRTVDLDVLDLGCSRHRVDHSSAHGLSLSHRRSMTNCPQPRNLPLSASWCAAASTVAASSSFGHDRLWIPAADRRTFELSPCRRI